MIVDDENNCKTKYFLATSWLDSWINWSSIIFLGLLASFEKLLRVNSQTYDQAGVPQWEAEGIYQLSANANGRFDANLKRKQIEDPKQNSKSCWEISYNFMLLVNSNKNYLTIPEQWTISLLDFMIDFCWSINSLNCIKRRVHRHF